MPRVESLELRAPTPLENYLGADAGFSARLMAPETKDSDHFMNLRMEIINDAGQKWSGNKKNWEKVTRSGRINFPNQGSSTLWEVENGLMWKEIVGKGDSASVNVVFEEKNATSAQTFSRVARTFILTNDLPSTPPLNRNNFLVKRIDLISQMAQRGIEHEYEHRFMFTIQIDNIAKSSHLLSSWTLNWQLAPKIGRKKVELNLVSLQESTNSASLPMQENQIQLELSLLEYSRELRGHSCRLSGVLSIDQGWPQQIFIELPQGFPLQLPYEQTNLPFTAKLAPLPK